MRKILGLLLLFQITNAQSNLRGPASMHLTDNTNPKVFDMKKATFEDCNTEVLKKNAAAKFDFLHDCIPYASANLKKGSDPRVCFATAGIITTEDVQILVKRCQSELGYDLCKVDTPMTDFQGRLDCIVKNKRSMAVADCKPDIQEIQKVMSQTKAQYNLSKKQEAVLRSDFCQKEIEKILSPSLKPATPAQK